MLNDFFKGVFKSVELSPEGKVVNITGMRLIQDSCGKVFLECTTDDWTNSIFPIVTSDSNGLTFVKWSGLNEENGVWTYTWDYDVGADVDKRYNIGCFLNGNYTESDLYISPQGYKGTAVFIKDYKVKNIGECSAGARTCSVDNNQCGNGETCYKNECVNFGGFPIPLERAEIPIQPTQPPNLPTNPPRQTHPAATPEHPIYSDQNSFYCPSKYSPYYCSSGSVFKDAIIFDPVHFINYSLNPSFYDYECVNRTVSKFHIVERCDYGCLNGGCLQSEVKDLSNPPDLAMKDLFYDSNKIYTLICNFGGEVPNLNVDDGRFYINISSNSVREVSVLLGGDFPGANKCKIYPLSIGPGARGQPIILRVQKITFKVSPTDNIERDLDNNVATKDMKIGTGLTPSTDIFTRTIRRRCAISHPFSDLNRAQCLVRWYNSG